MEIKLIDIKLLRPHEETNLIHLEKLHEKINKDGFWSNPIIIDSDTNIIMDGHHRYSFAKIAGFSLVPCYEMSYSSKNIEVFHWETGEPFPYQHIFEVVNSGKVFPAKTTRHQFNKKFDEIKLDLAQLY